MRVAVASNGSMRRSHTIGDEIASRRWTAAIVAAIALHAVALWLAAHWTPAPPQPLEPPAYPVELVRLPQARPQPKIVRQQPVHPVPEHVVRQPARPLTHPAELPHRVQLKTAQTHFHRGIVSAPPVTQAPAADTPPREPAATAEQPAATAVAPAQPPAATQALPAAAAPAPAMSAAQAVPADPNWQGLLIARLAKFKSYPAAARGQAGMPLVQFTLDRHGNVVAESLVRSSGVDAIDREALALVRRAAPFPAPPPDVTDDQLTITVPIEYRVRDRF